MITFKLLFTPVYRFIFCACLLLLSCMTFASPQSARHHTAQRILDLQRTLNFVPGMSAAVWREGEIVWHGASGFSDLARQRKVDQQTRFRLASVSKIFAATAAAKLIDEGKLNPDAPIHHYLPWINPTWSQITVRQLAAHTSGVPHYQAIDVMRGGHRFLSAQEAIAIFHKRDLLFSSGTQYNYSSYGYTLLTGVIEAVTQQHYLDYLREHIVTDLPIQADMAEKYDHHTSRAYELSQEQANDAPPHDYSYSWGGAGLSSTASDLARFGGRLLTDKIISKQRLAWQQQITPLTNGQPAGERDFRMGFGWRISLDEQAQTILHHAGNAIGARSVIILFPQERIAIALLSNASWISSIEQTALSIAASFRDQSNPEPQSNCPVHVQRYQGKMGEVALQGKISFQVRQGQCEAEMMIDNALGEWMSGAAKRPITSVQLISYEGQKLSDMAMVTAIGTYMLSAQKSTQGSLQFSAKLNANRHLELALF